MKLCSKNRLPYAKPTSGASPLELESLLCASFNITQVQVDELHNMNTVSSPDECFDIEL